LGQVSAAIMLQSTEALILRVVPYSDTSLIVSALTRRYGLQQYMVKGARQQSKKGGSKTSFLQPGALLDLVVYYHEQKQWQLIKEMNWAYVYTQVMASISRNAIALFMVELLSKSIRQTESQEELYDFVRTNFLLLDTCDQAVAANLPLFFSLKLAGMLGFGMEDEYTDTHAYLDMQAGSFVQEYPIHGQYLDADLSYITHQLLQQHTGVTLYRIKLQQAQRRMLLQAYIHFFQFHLPDFGHMKSIQVLQEVLG
jgi:DNA repair protein RecO (recombination protein O)